MKVFKVLYVTLDDTDTPAWVADRILCEVDDGSLVEVLAQEVVA